MTKRWIATAVVTAGLGWPAAAMAHHTDTHMTVAKSPTCGCCGAWAEIARKHGFDVEIEDTEDLTPIKQAAGVPPQMAGCHTARVGGYVIEGHVPMAAIDRLLAERPNIRGLSVPGMPMGSPGMGDDPAARFDVHAFGTPKGDEPVFYRAGPSTN